MKRNGAAVSEDTERTVLPASEEETRLEAIARRAAEQVFRTAVIHALPAIRVEASPGSHAYIEGQHYEFRCFEGTVIHAQLLQVSDADLLCRTVAKNHVVIPRRSVIVAYLEERGR